MRKSFDGLHALVREHLELDAFAEQMPAKASNCITAFTNACSSSKLRRRSHGEAYR
jgi:hypothetical protein